MITPGVQTVGRWRPAAFALLLFLALGGAIAWWFTPPRPQGPGDQIIVDKSRNRLYYYSAGRLVRSYPVATGRHIQWTPEGRFYIASKLVDPLGGPDAGSRLGSRWMGLATPQDLLGTRYGIHGTSEPGSMGTHASAGCIRMHNIHVEELYDLVAVGTPVEIRRGWPWGWRLHQWLDQRSRGRPPV